MMEKARVEKLKRKKVIMNNRRICVDRGKAMGVE